MKHISKQIALFLFMVSSSLVDAHQDTVLSVKDGKVIGLPKEYLPASFDYKRLSLSIGDKQLTFPKVLFHLLKYDASEDPSDGNPKWKLKPYTYKFVASWYHHKTMDILPPYLLITISSKKGGEFFELLIDMEKVVFLGASVHTKDFGIVPIDLDGNPDNPKK